MLDLEPIRERALDKVTLNIAVHGSALGSDKDISALIAEVDRLRKEVKRLTECSCGLSLSSGLCRICDKDD